MFIRKKKNRSGSISIQVIDTSEKQDRLLKSLGSTKDPQKLKRLIQQAHKFISEYRGQEEIAFEYNEDKTFIEYLKTGLENIKMIGPELILGKIYNEIGFNKIEDELFRHLIISRLVFPLSKLKTTEYPLCLY